MSERRTLCERARTWAALAPDGELSSFERRLLDAHLHRCAECSAFAARVDAISEALRAEPLEPLPHPISLAGLVRSRARRYAPRRVFYSTAAAAAAVVALSLASGVALTGSHELTGAATSPLVVVVGDGDEQRDARDMRELRRVQLVSDIQPQTSSRAHHFGVAQGL
jgi:anti-sigma factor RsiW